MKFFEEGATPPLPQQVEHYCWKCKAWYGILPCPKEGHVSKKYWEVKE